MKVAVHGSVQLRTTGPDQPARRLLCVKLPQEGWGLEMETLDGFPALWSPHPHSGPCCFFKRDYPEH